MSLLVPNIGNSPNHRRIARQEPRMLGIGLLQGRSPDQRRLPGAPTQEAKLHRLHHHLLQDIITIRHRLVKSRRKLRKVKIPTILLLDLATLSRPPTTRGRINPLLSSLTSVGRIRTVVIACQWYTYTRLRNDPHQQLPSSHLLR